MGGGQEGRKVRRGEMRPRRIKTEEREGRETRKGKGERGTL